MTEFELFPDVPEGWEGYVPVLFPDNDVASSLRAQQVEVAVAVWRKREQRREEYVARWGGDIVRWPAQHPTTVVEIRGPVGAALCAVCIRCGWIEPGDDRAGLHGLAKRHGLAHPHDPRLEGGENPTKPPRPVGRRVALRGTEAIQARIEKLRGEIAESHDSKDE